MPNAASRLAMTLSAAVAAFPAGAGTAAAVQPRPALAGPEPATKEASPQTALDTFLAHACEFENLLASLQALHGSLFRVDLDAVTWADAGNVGDAVKQLARIVARLERPPAKPVPAPSEETPPGLQIRVDGALFTP